MLGLQRRARCPPQCLVATFGNLVMAGVFSVIHACFDRIRTDFCSMGALSRDSFRTLASGYWNAPVKSPKRPGGVNIESIYCAVGHALSIWESVEVELSAMYSVVSEVNTLHASIMLRKTFGLIEANSGRRQALKYVLEQYLGVYQLPEIKWIINILDQNLMEASHRRNEIAHGMALMFSPGVSKGREGMAGAYLIAPIYMTARNASTADAINDPQWAVTSTYCYTPADIDLMADKFAALKQHVIATTETFRKDESKTPKIITWIREQNASAHLTKKHQ
jgi:hypothetical protein